MIYLNKTPITAITDEFTSAAQTLLQLLYPMDIKDNVYTFATKWKTLAPDANVVPPVPYYNFQYTLPNDYIKYIDMWPRFDYDIVSGQKLYTSVNPLQLKYVFVPPYEDLPFDYVNFLAKHLGAELAMSRMQMPELYAILKDESLEARARAGALDGQTVPNNFFRNSRYIAPNAIANIGPTYF